jgi:hypothetical protein
MADKVTGLEGTTTLRLPSEGLSELFQLTDEGNLIVRNAGLAKLIAEQSRLPQTMARASTEVTVSVSVKF